jgi:hypothetical protein
VPQIVIFLEDLGWGEEGIAEMLTPVLIKRLILWFLIVSITWGSSAFMVVTGARMVGPWTCHWVGGSSLIPLGTEDSVPSMISLANGAESQR